MRAMIKVARMAGSNSGLLQRTPTVYVNQPNTPPVSHP